MKIYEKVIFTGVLLALIGLSGYLFLTRNQTNDGLSEQIRGIEQSLVTITELQSTLDRKITDIDTRFLSMGDEISRSRSAIDSLGKGLSGIKSSISGFRADLQQFRNGLPELEALANNSARGISEAQRIVGEIKEGLK